MAQSNPVASLEGKESNPDNKPQAKFVSIEIKEKDIYHDPNRIWKWFVLLSAFLLRIIMAGVYVSFALYTSDFVKDFKISPSFMSWMIASYSALSLLVSPLAGFLAVKFGNRALATSGLIIAGLAYPAIYFYPMLWFNFLTASIIVPMSQGLCNYCISVILPSYFKADLAIASGIYYSGSGFASLLITPIMLNVINTFGWRLSKVLYSFMYIIAILLTFFFRPAKTDQTETKEICDSVEGKDEAKRVNFINSVCVSKESHLHAFVSMASIAAQFPTIEETKNYVTSHQSISVNKQEVNMINVSVSTIIGLSVASNINIKAAIENAPVQNIEIVIPKDDQLTQKETKTSGYLDLLKNPIFMLFLLSNLLLNLGSDTPYLYTKEKALELGITDGKATSLLTLIGVGNIIGRIGFGIFCSKIKINPYLINSMCLILAGFFVLLGRFAVSFSPLIIYAVCFGVFIGGNITLVMVILVNNLGLSDFKNGMHMLFVIQAIGLIFGAPLSGFIYDVSGSFNYSFLLCGSLLLIGGILPLMAFSSKKFREDQVKR